MAEAKQFSSIIIPTVRNERSGFQLQDSRTSHIKACNKGGRISLLREVKICKVKKKKS